jgi:transcription termination/antitermination protein NusG
MTNKQRRALRREKARERSQKRRVQRTVAVNMRAVRAGTHTAAREALPRFEVDLHRTWYVVRTLPRWVTRAAE